MNTFEDVKSEFKDITSIKQCKNFAFEGFSSMVESKCHIVLLEKKNGMMYVICSQLDNYYGTSVTNGVESIKSELEKTNCLNKEYVWLEHYPIGVGISATSYTLMQVEFDESENPSWDSRITWEVASKKFEVELRALAFGYEHELK